MDDIWFCENYYVKKFLRQIEVEFSEDYFYFLNNALQKDERENIFTFLDSPFIVLEDYLSKVDEEEWKALIRAIFVVKLIKIARECEETGGMNVFDFFMEIQSEKIKSIFINILNFLGPKLSFEEFSNEDEEEECCDFWVVAEGDFDAEEIFNYIYDNVRYYEETFFSYGIFGWEMLDEWGKLISNVYIPTPCDD